MVYLFSLSERHDNCNKRVHEYDVTMVSFFYSHAMSVTSGKQKNVKYGQFSTQARIKIGFNRFTDISQYFFNKYIVFIVAKLISGKRSAPFSFQECSIFRQ